MTFWQECINKCIWYFSDQDHLRLCRSMSYEVDVQGFPENNTQQHIAIRKALNSRFSLIQGPPGTLQFDILTK